MQNDIYIRRVTAEFGSADETSVKLCDFLNEKIQDFRSYNWGQIDYVVVPQKTSLNQNDYVAFVAFRNRKIHSEVVNELRKIQPLHFGKRGMLFEINSISTTREKQVENRARFINIRHSLAQKRYRDEKPENETETKPGKKIKPLEETVDESSIDSFTKTEDKTEDKTKWIEEKLNEKIPVFLAAAKLKSMKEKPVDTLLGPSGLKPKREELRIRSLELRVQLLEAELAEKSAEIESLKEEKERFKNYLLSGLDMFQIKP